MAKQLGLFSGDDALNLPIHLPGAGMSPISGMPGGSPVPPVGLATTTGLARTTPGPTPGPGSGSTPRLPITGAARHVPGMGTVGTPPPTNPRNAPSNLVRIKESIPESIAKNIKTPTQWTWLGRLMGWGMAAWAAWAIMEAVGLTGKKGKADKETLAALNALNPQMQQRESNAFQYQDALKERDDMTAFANFAQAKQTGQRDMGMIVSSELDQLLGGKASLLSRASLASPVQGRAIQGLAQGMSGGF